MLPFVHKLNRQTFARLLRFAIVGCFGTLLYGAVVWVFICVFGINTIPATSMGFIAVVAANYLLHYSWTFRSVKRHRIAFGQFVVTSVIGFCINVCSIYVGVFLLHLNYIEVQVASVILVITSNYLLTAAWVFRSE